MCQSAEFITEYLGRSGNAKDYQFSYSNSWQRISYTFSASQSYDENDKEEERFNLFISIPFYWGDDIAKTRHQITGGEVEMLKITNSVTPITGNTLVILSLPANLMMKIIKKRSV